MKFPHGRFGGEVVRETVRLMDLAPTLLEILRVRPTPTFQGISFFSLLAGLGNYRPPILSYQPLSEQTDLGGYAYRLEDGEYVFSTKEPALFNAESDPGELDNLYNREGKKVRQFRRKVRLLYQSDRSFLSNLGGAGPTERKADRKLLDQLKALGYVD